MPEGACKYFQRTPEVCWVFPENWPALELASAMGGQWIMGPGGPVAMNYAALPMVEERLGVSLDDRAELFQCLRVVEDEMLKAWAEARENQGSR